jgi:peroxiredoxin
MKKLILFQLLFLVAVVSACQSSKDENTYTIDGSLINYDSGDAYLVKLDLHTNNVVYVDTAEIVAGNFYFKGKLEMPYLHGIYFDNPNHKLDFFLENSAIKLEADYNKLPNVVVSGSREDSLFRPWYENQMFEKEADLEIMTQHPDYFLAAFIAFYHYQVFDTSPDSMKMVLETFRDPVTTSEYYSRLTDLYEKSKKTSIGQIAPSFTIPNIEGNPISLSDFNGKYILLDFWASWCKPCRAANPQLVELYNRYSKHNFTIVGISVDESRDSWLKAIEQDALPWPQLSDVDGWNTETPIEYGVRAVPQNFLLNPKGRIIAKNLEVAALESMLRTTLIH